MSGVRRTAFVTGAAGLVGRHLAERLVAEGWTVIAFCLATDEVRPLRPLAEVRFGDLKNLESVIAAMPEAPDAVFHVAANTSTWSRQAAAQYKDNVLGTANLIEASLQSRAERFIYTSSISAYGYQPGELISEVSVSNALTAGDDYGRTKLEAEQRIRDAVSRRGLQAVILNPVNIVGPYDRSNWSDQLILPISKGELRAVPPGSATWAHVDDVVAAHIAAVDRGRIGQNYLLGGVRASFKTVVNEIEDILGRPRSPRTTPGFLLAMVLATTAVKARLDGKRPLLTAAQYRRAVGDLRCDDAKARRELGYRHRDLSAMLGDTIAWLRSEDLLPDAESGEPSQGTCRRDHRLGASYVDVEDEPHHVERFRNEYVRVYLATIPPGSGTLYHRHTVDTLYVVISGGAARSHEPGRQRVRSRVGRSVRTPTKLAWGLRRAFSRELDLPAGTVLMQYHARCPLTHQLQAAAGNRQAIEMLGIEMRSAGGRGRRFARAGSEPIGLSVEYEDRNSITYAVHLESGRRIRPISTDDPSLLVLLGGHAELRQGKEDTDVDVLTPGSPWWLGTEEFELFNPGDESVTALLILLKVGPARTTA